MDEKELKTFGDLFKRKNIKEELLCILSTIINAMAALEKIGIVYSDLKPHNILLKYTTII